MKSFLPATGKCRDLYEKFKEMFPGFVGDVKLFGPFDRQTIKIELKDKNVLIFNYNGAADWGLQTYKNYLDSLMPKR